MYQSHYSVPLSYDLTTFYILGQKFVKFFVGFLENLRYQKDILRLTELYNYNRQIIVNNNVLKWEFQVPAFSRSKKGFYFLLGNAVLWLAKDFPTERKIFCHFSRKCKKFDVTKKLCFKFGTVFHQKQLLSLHMRMNSNQTSILKRFLHVLI